MYEYTELLDSHAIAIYLEVPAAKIVLLQATFELYEGLGIVKTLQGDSSLICVLTSPDLLEDCLKALESLKGLIGWSFASKTELAGRQLKDD